MLSKPASLLYRQLSSAAVDLELARISKTWDVDEMEIYVLQRRSGSSHAEAIAARVARGRPRRDKKTFHALRLGRSLKPGHASRLQALFPASRLLLWASHPLAEVLCHPGLGPDHLLGYLQQLPAGPVRDCVFHSASVHTVGLPSIALTAWTSELRHSLSRIGTPVALFALILRLRLEQRLGRADGGLEATQIAWRMIPGVVARSHHLRVAKDALVLALDYFFSLQPYADARLYELTRVEATLGREVATAECERIWLSDSSIPRWILDHRRRLARADLVPWNEGEWSWWSLLYSPVGLCRRNGDEAELIG